MEMIDQLSYDCTTSALCRRRKESNLKARNIQDTQDTRTKHRAPDLWAPWWWYLIAMVFTNLIRTAIMPDDAPIVAVILVFLIVTSAVIALVTAAYRATRRP
jgi:hypothetical protein